MLATWPAPRRASFAPDRSPNQSALTSRPTARNPSSPVRHTPRSPRETKSRRSTHAAPKQPDASLEVSSPSARSNRDALSGAAKRPDNPASAFYLRRATRASATFALQSRPCGFSLCGCDAALLDVRTCVACGFAIESRRAEAAAKRLHAKSTCLRSLVQAPIGETDRSRSRATRHIKRHRFALIRCLSRVMHRRVPWGGVPLPSGSSRRGLVGRVVLPSCSPGGAHGVHTLRRFAPAERVAGHF